MSHIPRTMLTALVLLTALLWLFCSPAAWAQSTPNLELENEALQDTIAATKWGHFFPIWGEAVVAKGFELPLPVGINLQWLGNYQEMKMTNLSLGVNDQGLVDVSEFLAIGHTSITTNSFQIRPDLWVLPFLNVYGLFGIGLNTVDVTVGRPTEFKARIERDASLLGFGGNVSFAVSRYFIVADGNMTWADVDGVDQDTRATVISARIGRSFLLPGTARLTGWIGFMHLGLQSDTSGSIRLGDVLPGLEDFLENYQDSEWYNDLTRAQQRAVDEIIAQIAERNPQDTTIQYALEKSLSSQWSVVFGGQYQFTPHWMFRLEYSQSEKRGALLLNLNYRFGL